MNNNSANDTSKMIRQITYLAIMTSLVVILQLLGNSIRLFGVFSISLVLIPIVIGAAMCGPLAGGWLGAVFAVVVLFSGASEPFFTINPFGTIVTVLLKGILCGLAAGIVYKLIEKKNRFVATFSAAVICPVVNTGVFLIGCLLFFLPTITEWAGGGDLGYYMITGLVGLNFVVELVINIVLSPVVVQLLNIKIRH